MLERFRHQPTPEAPPQQLVKTLIIPCVTENSSGQEPQLDPKSRISALAGGIMVDAGVVGQIVAVGNPEGIRRMEKYVVEELGVPEKAFLSKESSGEHAAEIKSILKDHRFGDIGLISAGETGKHIKDALEDMKIDLSPILPEKEINARMAHSIGASLNIATEILKEVVVKIARSGKLLDSVHITKLSLSHAR